ncbi:MAG: FAD-binding oxidoreductase [Actinomycetota bacterium]|nr:FAD-binding oxidoreductase [Actinomycetota bacterium]
MSIQATHVSNFAGELIGREHPGYDEARKLFNGMIDRRPALIARCSGPEDVAAALAHAREQSLTVAVRGGGHSAPGYSCCENGIVIDTGPIKSVEIDVERRTGRFGAGLTWGELDHATQEHGLAVTGGRVTHTGVAGLTLGSGSGWLERKYGITCESLISAEVVTADGHVLRASAEQNHDLFWGLKGGGGNFGVVTEFEFRLHPVGPIVFGGMLLYPRAAAPDLLRFYRDFMGQAPDEACGGFSLLTAPPEEFVPEPARGKPACGVVLLYAGDPQQGEEAFRPLLAWGEPWVKLVQPMPYVALQQMLDPAHPWGIGYYAKTDYLPELPDEAIDAMVDKAAEIGSPLTGLHLAPLGGAVARADRSTMALEVPNVPWYYMCMALAWDPAQAERETEWARALMQTLRPWTVDKAPPNFINKDEGHTRLRSSYGEQKFERLVTLKDKYDPHNVFSLNQNIPPSTRAAGV